MFLRQSSKTSAQIESLAAVSSGATMLNGIKADIDHARSEAGLALAKGSIPKAALTARRSRAVRFAATSRGNAFATLTTSTHSSRRNSPLRRSRSAPSRASRTNVFEQPCPGNALGPGPAQIETRRAISRGQPWLQDESRRANADRRGFRPRPAKDRDRFAVRGRGAPRRPPARSSRLHEHGTICARHRARRSSGRAQK